MKAVAWRVWLGFVLAPVVPCACVVLPLWGDVGALKFLLTVMLGVCWVVTALIGVPAYLFLGRYGRVTLWHCLAGGALAAMACYRVLSGSMSGDEQGAGVVKALLSYLVFGTSIGLCFWLIALRVPAPHAARTPPRSARRFPSRKS